MVKMAQGAVTGMVIINSPEGRVTRLDDCPTCDFTKSKPLLFKEGRSRATRPLRLVHGDLVGPMPARSIGGSQYGFILVDDYSRAGCVLALRAKSDAPIEFVKIIFI